MRKLISNKLPMQAALLTYKLVPPLPTFLSVQRSKLNQLIQDNPQGKICVVCGPAGFGKTSFMRQRYEYDKVSHNLAAWLTLDSEDNDPQRFLSYLAASINDGWVEPDGEPTKRPWSRLPDGLSIEWVFDQIADLASRQSKLSLFLDDFEVINNPQIHKILNDLISNLPPGSRLYIGGRHTPQLELSRIKTQGYLTEIGADRLRFSEDEAHELITNISGTQISDELKRELLDHSEGWVTALQLAAMSINKQLDPQEYIRNFNGTYIELGDYLTQEILLKQSDAMQGFLAKTSVLETLSPELCNAVCEISDSDIFLREAVQANLFLYPLNPEHTLFKYHKLFSEFLSRTLEKQYKAAIPQLHLRASEWHAANGNMTAAVRHALGSNNHHMALVFINRSSLAFVKDGRLSTVVQWVESLPELLWRNKYDLQVYYALSLTGTFQYRKASSLLHKLSDASILGKLGAEASGLLLFTAPFQLINQDKFHEALAICDRNLKLISRGDNLGRGGLLNIRALCLLHLARYKDSQQTVIQAKALTARRSLYGYSYAQCISGLCELGQGNLQAAQAIFKNMLDMAYAESSQYSAAVAVSACCLAETLYESNALEQAATLLKQHDAAITNLGIPDMVIVSRLVNTRLVYSSNGLLAAFQALNDMKNLGDARDLPRMTSAAWAEQSRLALNHNDIDSAIRYLEIAEYVTPLEIIGDESAVTLKARLYIAQEEPGRAVKLLANEIMEAEERQQGRYGLKLKILQCIAWFEMDRKKEAMQLLHVCIDVAARENFIRVFVNEGMQLYKIVQEYKAVGAPAKWTTYLNDLLSSFSTEVADCSIEPSLVEKLSRREFQVLQLIDKGYTNQKIANKIFLSLPTIK